MNLRFFWILTKLIGVLLLFRAPTDCLQYYTTTSGEIKSFNFGSGLMTNLRYDVCIRESVGKNYNIFQKYFDFYTDIFFKWQTICILGYCSFEVHQTASSPDGFYLGTSSTASAVSILLYFFIWFFWYQNLKIFPFYYQIISKF